MNDVNGFGGTVIQVVVHPLSSPRFVAYRFGGTVIQVVVHSLIRNFSEPFRFGSTVNQTVVHRLLAAKAKELVSEAR